MNDSLPSPDPGFERSALPARVAPATVVRRPPAGNSRAGAAPQPQGLTPQFVWRVFCNWWKLVAPLGLVLAAGAGAAVWFLHQPQFESAAIVRIEAVPQFIAFDKGTASSDTERYVQTQIELLRGPVVLNPVLGRPEIAALPDIQTAADPLKQLEKHLTVRQIGKSELHWVSYTAGDPQEAATMANAVVEEYMKLQNTQEKERLGIVLRVLEEERMQRGLSVERLRKQVVELAREVTGRDPFGQGVITDPVAFAPAATLYQSLTETDIDYAVLKAELEGLTNAPLLAEDTELASGLRDLEISNRPDVRRLEDRLGVLRQRLTELKSKPRLKLEEAAESDPELVQLTQEEQQVDQELKALQALAKQDLVTARREQRKADQASQLAAKQVELGLLTKKRQLLVEKLETQMSEIKSGGARSAELDFAKAELEREQSVFELIAARKLALQTEQRAPARVTLEQIAKPARIAIEPIPYKYLLLACSLALLAPLGLAVAYEALTRRISSSEDLRQESSLIVLGEVARFPRQYHSSQPQLALSSSQQREAIVFSESIDSLRTQLMLTEQVGVAGQQRIIAICSAASGEGKSSLATSLTLSLAEATKRPTLLIDADLRAPDIAQLLQVPSRPGIAELVEGQATLKEAIHRVGNSCAYVLPAGRLKGSPHHVFEGFKIEKVLKALRAEFDTIIIDTPPVLAASDALVYAKSADLVVFCSLADSSRAKQVRYAVERLQATGANVAGAVLSGVPVQSYAYRYGTYGPDA